MKISVRLAKNSYPIAITDSFQGLPAALRKAEVPQKGLLVSHQGLLRRYKRGLLEALKKHYSSLEILAIPESESSKSFTVLQRIVDRLALIGGLQAPSLVAFGGGVVGDVSGFAAAIFRRGIAYIQVPTTLLGQVDSGIGGKTGIDIPAGKNLVGAFHQPRLVYNNILLLRSLALRQRRCGLAEVIKYAVIADISLFDYLQSHMKACLALEASALRVVVERCCRIKAEVVSQDEKDQTGKRAHLNFGHTIGHALEAAGRYQRWTHGEAIAVGMIMAADLAVQMDLLPSRDWQRLRHLIRAAGLPIHAKAVDRRLFMEALGQDKKFIHGRMRWVLPTRIGKVVVTEEISKAVFQRVLTRYIAFRK